MNLLINNDDSNNYNNNDKHNDKDNDNDIAIQVWLKHVV